MVKTNLVSNELSVTLLGKSRNRQFEGQQWLRNYSLELEPECSNYENHMSEPEEWIKIDKISDNIIQKLVNI